MMPNSKKEEYIYKLEWTIYFSFHFINLCILFCCSSSQQTHLTFLDHYFKKFILPCWQIVAMSCTHLIDSITTEFIHITWKRQRRLIINCSSTWFSCLYDNHINIIASNLNACCAERLRYHLRFASKVRCFRFLKSCNYLCTYSSEVEKSTPVFRLDRS